jgi:CheY-like chemotaxis protein
MRPNTEGIEKPRYQPSAQHIRQASGEEPRSQAGVKRSRDGKLQILQTSRRRVLVIEDNRDGRETLRILLQLIGHEVEVAADGIEGLEKAHSSHPDVIVLDIGLPRLNGYEVARQLRAQFGDSLLLIAHTGYGQPEDRRQALEAGCNVHLIKPVEIKELIQLLNRLPVEV